MPTVLLPCLQALLALSLDGAPVRFGVPLPAAAVGKGLRLEGKGVLQWRRLPVGSSGADPVWVELAIAAGHGRVVVHAGGASAHPDGRGPAFVREEREVEEQYGRKTTETWRWCDGTVDERVRTTFFVATTVNDTTWTAGESLTVESEGMAQRLRPVCRFPRAVFECADLLPTGGRLAAFVQKQLAEHVGRLPELPGARGAGDFGRAGGVVTNLEFDTTLAVLRCAVAFGDPVALALARRCARHLLDRDIDIRTGLPFPHGPDHRTGVPETGHVWLQGVLFVGLLSADDQALVAAGAIARALAVHPPLGEGRRERARDHAWPLFEIEAMLAVDPDPGLMVHADRLAIAIDSRFDPVARTFCFGEGATDEGVRFERAWVTAGVVVPALRAHLARRDDGRIAAHVRAVQQALLDRIDRPLPGVPTHWRIAAGTPFAEHRAIDEPEAVVMLDAFEPADLRRLLRRDGLRRALDEVLRPDDPDLATTFTMVGRCRWVWR